MTDLDLAELRRIAEDRLGGRFRNDGMADPETVLALLDRIESLEAERRRIVGDGGLLDNALRDNKNLAATAARLEARLARVTDDSIVRSLASTLAMSYGSHVNPPEGGRDWKAAEDVLATIRALAADEQEVCLMLHPITRRRCSLPRGHEPGHVCDLPPADEQEAGR